MNFEQRLAAGSKSRRLRHTEDRHGIAFVIVADEWKASVSSGLSEPRIALRQRAEFMIVTDGPLQSQTRDRAFHCMNNGNRTAVIAHQRGRVDMNAQGVLCEGHFSTTS